MVRHACAGPQSIEEVAECHFFDTLKQHASACCLPGSGSAHMVAVRCRRSGCLQLPVLELLRLPPPSAGRGRLRNVASRLGGVRLGKMSDCRLTQKQTARFCVLFAFVVSGSYLSSRAVASQVLSAYKGLTSVFGMGTGGTP